MDMIREDFKKYIRSSISDDFGNYSSFAITLKRVEGNPSFDIALDGTYSKTVDHIDSVICFCFNEKKTFCFIDDNIVETVKTAKESDENHNSNWNHEEKTTNCHVFHSIEYETNVFSKEGNYDMNFENQYFISVQVRSEAVLIDYKILSNYSRYTGYIDRTKL